MTGIEIIVAALAAGTAAGATAAVQDAYTTLRTALGARLRRRGEAVEQLDAVETDPGLWQARVGEDLAASGADADILAAAQAVLALTDPAGTESGKYHVDLHNAKGVQVGDHNTQHNTFS